MCGLTRCNSTVVTAKVAAEGFGHHMLANGPGEAGHAKCEEEATSEDAGFGVTAGVVERVIGEVRAENGEEDGEDKAEIFIAFHSIVPSVRRC